MSAAHRRRAPARPAYRAVKRLLDVIVAGLVLLAASPVLVVAAVAIKLDSPGPVLFRQERIGLRGRPFRILKLRTMHSDADEAVHRAYVVSLLRGGEVGAMQDADPVFKVAADPRITRVGRWLRASSIDELPQLANVLAGQMSLVGPRPDMPYAVAAYKPRHRARLDVPPGLTGLWQVSGRARLSPHQMLDLDVEYARRACLALDLQILVRTVPAVLRQVGSR